MVLNRGDKDLFSRIYTIVLAMQNCSLNGEQQNNAEIFRDSFTSNIPEDGVLLACTDSLAL